MEPKDFIRIEWAGMSLLDMTIAIMLAAPGFPEFELEELYVQAYKPTSNLDSQRRCRESLRNKLNKSVTEGLLERPRPGCYQLSPECLLRIRDRQFKRLYAEVTRATA